MDHTNAEVAAVNGTEPVIQGIDHLIVMSGNLDRSEQRWRSLGFATTPRGFHDTGGTANHLITLDRTYIELLGLVAPEQACAYRQIMTESPGPWGIALRGSADATFRLWSSLGLEVSPPSNLSRPVDIDGRSERARFRITMLARAPGLPFPIFCCEHLTPQFVWEPGRAAHPNGATSLRAVTVIVKDDRIRSQFERLLGVAAASDAGRPESVAVGESQIVFLDEADFARRYGTAATAPPAARPPIAAVTLASTDIEGARSAAQAAGAAVVPTARGGFIAAIPDEGVVLEWVALASP